MPELGHWDMPGWAMLQDTPVGFEAGGGPHQAGPQHPLEPEKTGSGEVI